MTIKRLFILLAIFLFGIGFAKHFKMDLKSMKSVENTATVQQDKDILRSKMR